MSAPVTFVHLTDLHISDPTVPEPHRFSDTSATLRGVLETLRTIEPRPSFVVVSGDNANNGEPGAYAELKRVWGDFDIPAFFALGNHDGRPGFYANMLGRDGSNDAPYDHDRVVDGIHVVVLDSSVPGSPHGTIEPEQFDWLEATLAVDAGLPKLIVIHHPPKIGEELRFETITEADTRRLGAILAGYNVVAILSGHVHYDRVSMWNGIPIVIATGLHSASDFLYRDGVRGLTGGSFALGTIRPTGLTVSYVPLPSDRRELFKISHERLAEMLDAHTGAETVAITAN